MVGWSEFEARAPALAAAFGERVERYGLVLVGTVRADGSPRISPVEPLVVDGELLLGMMWQSRKALDLVRDPRCAVHSVVDDKSGKQGEVKLYGAVVDVTDPGRRRAYADATAEAWDFRPEEPYHLFAFEVESASIVRYDGDDQSVERWADDGAPPDGAG